MLYSKKPRSLSHISAAEIIGKICQKSPVGTTKVSEIIDDFQENGLLLATIFAALPVAIPLPYPPGFTTILGLPLMILAIQMLLGGKRVWLPQKLNNYEIKNSNLVFMANKLVPIIKKMEQYLKPRYAFANSVYCEQVVGFISFLAAVFVLLPLPFTNAIPAQGISIMALGLLNRDGLVIIAGIIVALGGMGIALGFIFGGLIALKYVINFLF